MDIKFDFSLSPEELYYMAVRMNFKYMDYDYFANLTGIQKDYESFKEKCAWRLDERGLAEVDYDGVVSWIDKNLETALGPVFYGNQECNVIIGEDVIKIHIDGNNMTLTKALDEIMIKIVDITMLVELLRGKKFEIRSSHIEKGIYQERFDYEEIDVNKLEGRLNRILSGNCYL